MRENDKLSNMPIDDAVLLIGRFGNERMCIGGICMVMRLLLPTIFWSELPLTALVPLFLDTAEVFCRLMFVMSLEDDGTGLTMMLDDLLGLVGLVPVVDESGQFRGVDFDSIVQFICKFDKFSLILGTPSKMFNNKF